MSRVLHRAQCVNGTSSIQAYLPPQNSCRRLASRRVCCAARDYYLRASCTCWLVTARPRDARAYQQSLRVHSGTHTAYGSCASEQCYFQMFLIVLDPPISTVCRTTRLIISIISASQAELLSGHINVPYWTHSTAPRAGHTTGHFRRRKQLCYCSQQHLPCRIGGNLHVRNSFARSIYPWNRRAIQQ